MSSRLQVVRLQVVTRLQVFKASGRHQASGLLRTQNLRRGPRDATTKPRKLRKPENRENRFRVFPCGSFFQFAYVFLLVSPLSVKTATKKTSKTRNPRKRFSSFSPFSRFRRFRVFAVFAFSPFSRFRRLRPFAHFCRFRHFRSFRRLCRLRAVVVFLVFATFEGFQLWLLVVH